MPLRGLVWILFRVGFRKKSILLDFLRHSRAMHLYQHGVDLTLISQWLGHENLETTLIYAKADTEQKRKAIADANKSGPLASQLNSERFVVEDDELIKRLYGLR